MSFIIQGLSPEPYAHLFGLSDEALAEHGVYRYTVDAKPGYPDRVEMRDGDVGETMLLVNHVSMEKPTPFHASHAIFVREGTKEAYKAVDDVPEVMHRRLLSLRAFDADGMMVDAELAQGDAIAFALDRLLDGEGIAHVDAHYALRGCFAARVTHA
ncbi:MAG: DUF1203 domain-containing protein [Pseudomonadota bacterium]